MSKGNYDYVAIIATSPYSTGRGQVIDDRDVEAYVSVAIKANDFDDACDKLSYLVRGIRCNPHAHWIRVVSLAKVGDQPPKDRETPRK